MTATGGPEVLQLREVPLPQLQDPSYLRVRLHASGVNPVDTKIRKANTYYPGNTNIVLGCDGAGVVESCGHAVKRFKPGDAVFFCHGGIGGDPGNYAEFIALHEDYCAALPAGLSMVEAAALPLAFITAWEALMERAQLISDESVLIHAAAGGVGHIAVQIARDRGARIAATVSGADKA
ncbi:MAG: alcohol dehydrogenase catalytic domain-containing protein, partial [Burkholderiales bacterium]